MNHEADETNSSITCFRRCPREYLYSYVQLRRPVRKPKSIEVGSIVHIGLNAYWRTRGSLEERKLSSIDAMRSAFSDPMCGLDSWDMVRVEEMLLGYANKWGADDAVTETLSVEERFSVNGISGSIDAVVRKSGKLMLIEHKTSSKDCSVGSSYWDNIVSIDSQVSTYLLAMMQIGHTNLTCMYDVLRKVSLCPQLATKMEDRKYTRPTKGNHSRLYLGMRDADESIGEYRLRVREHIKANQDCYYVRQMVVRTDSELDEHRMDVDATLKMMRRCGLHFPRHTHSCQRFNQTCSYHRVCSGVDSIDSNYFRTATHRHEELVT